MSAEAAEILAAYARENGVTIRAAADLAASALFDGKTVRLKGV